MYNAEQLTRIIKQIRDRKDIRESTKNMRILTTLGTLHEAIRAISTVDDSKPYQYAPNVHRGLHGTNAPNSYPPEFKAKIVMQLPTTYNDAALAKEYGVSPRTIYRWRKQYNINRDDDTITQLAGAIDAEDDLTPLFEEGEL